MWHTFEGSIIQGTVRAVFFQSHYWEEPLWMPRSQVMVTPDGEDTVVLKVKNWLASKKGLQEFTEYTGEQMREMANV